LKKSELTAIIQIPYTITLSFNTNDFCENRQHAMFFGNRPSFFMT